MKRLSILLSMFLLLTTIHAQDLERYKEITKELSSAKYKGRGYTYNGVQKAGRYLKKQYLNAGVDTIMNQSFTQDINTFPGNTLLQVDGKKLVPGSDFTMREFSPGAKGEYRLYYIDTVNYDENKLKEELSKPEYRDCYLVADFWFAYRRNLIRETGLWQQLPVAGAIYIWDSPLKFYKAYGHDVVSKPIVWSSPDFPRNAQNIKIDVDNKFLTNYQSDNIIAKIKGKSSDSVLVFVAHYDHQGVFGKKLYFPGLNDNASGTAALVTLAEHYAKPENRPAYDMWFLSVAGEETGLLGSMKFVEEPLFPLSKIKYLINLDMIGDNNPIQYCEVSEQGVRGFELMKRINAEKHYFKDFNRGELAGNSDHYPFAEKGVPCILFEQEDGECFPLYHTAQDNLENAKYETYAPIFKLILDFVDKY